MTALVAPKILVVDDEVLIAMLVADMLEDLGRQVVGPALTLDEAMTLAEGSDLDGAILDVNLDGLSTLPVAKVLRGRRVPFVFASGSLPDSVDAEFCNVGWLQKPFEFATLARVLHEAELG